MPELLTPNERFAARVRQWRLQHPNPTEAYLKAIPKIVADSMAFEGDHIDIRLLQEKLAHR